MKLLAIVLGSLALSACGGGSDSGPVAPVALVASVDTFQLRTAYIDRYKQSISLVGNYSGTVSGVSITGTATAVAGAPTNTSFEGTAALQKVGTITGNLTGNGVTVPVSSTSVSYADATYYPLGSYSPGKYAVVTGAVNIPVSARIYDTGIAYTENRYSSSNKLSFLGTSQMTFALEADTSSTALLKLIHTERNTAGTMTNQSISTYRMTPAGGLTDISVSVIDPAANTNLLVTF